MAKKVSENAIGDVLSDDWGKDASNGLPYSGQAVQDALKAKLQEHEDSINRLLGVGENYFADLEYDKSDDVDYVTIDGTFSVGVRFIGTHYTGTGTENANITGTLKIEVSTDGGITYTQKGTVTGLRSRSSSYTDYDEVDLSSYLSSGSQVIRLSVSYTVDGTTISSGSKIVYVTYTALGLRYDPNANLSEALAATAGSFPYAYQMRGSVKKTLHVKLTGEYGSVEVSEVTFSASEYSSYNSGTYESAYSFTGDDTYGLLTHGVKTMEAWLTCSADGTDTNILESDHVITQRMVDADEDDASVYVLIQGLTSIVENYVQTTLMTLALYSKDSDATEKVIVRLSDKDDETSYYSDTIEMVYGETYTVTTMIEVEGTADTLYAYLHIEDADGNSLASSQTITVDNTSGYGPTSNAVFILNPKSRSNDEDTPQTIINAATGDNVDATFEGFTGGNDLWQENSDGKVLRVLAGEKVTIGWDWLKAFADSAKANVTMEIDCMVSNVTNETGDIINMCQTAGGVECGLKMQPLEGAVYSKSAQNETQQNFGFQENKRTRITVSICSNIEVSRQDKDTPYSGNLCRIYIDGVIERGFKFSTDTNDWYGSGSEMVIGHDYADIDIYGIRIYEQQLTPTQVQNDYVATMPTSAEKIAFREENDLTDGGYISISKCAEHGKDYIIWHGDVPSNEDQSSKTGWYEIYRYDSSGNYLADYSGTICKDTASAVEEGQGSTAKGYFEWNGQCKLKDVDATISIETKYLHEDITWEVSEDGTELVMYGCGLGKNDWANDEDIREAGAKSYDYDADSDTVTVPDGWIDGNGMYRGKCYKNSDTSGYAIKLQRKINYASSMQSHLPGANKAYNDLQKAVVGRIGIQADNASARTAKYQDPMLFFKQAADSNDAIYMGPCTFGGAKMDDASVGFDKKQYPYFCMMEGSDNNYTLTDFRTPFDEDKITWVYDETSPQEDDNGVTYYEAEGFSYNGQDNFDLDKYVASKTYAVQDGVNVEVPNETTMQRIKDFVNFVYLHSPRIKCFEGAMTGTGGFLSSDSASETGYKWWCTDGTDGYQYRLMRYDEVEGAWVDAGWDAASNSKTEVYVNEEYADAFTDNADDYDAINTAIVSAIVEDARATIGDIIHAGSLRFHYNFVNVLLGGSDNNSKNTYYCLVPYTTTDSDGNSETKQIWMLFQDDLDTIFKTDNSGYQTKPYYIDRQHDCKEGTTTSLYQGTANVLFDLEEALYEDTYENCTMMASILTAMCDLSSGGSVWSFFEDYFFSVQENIPAVAYNEAHTIRYEWPSLYGFLGTKRGEDPITQGCGSQLQSELQYMKRRVVLYASYAGWGDFGRSGQGSVGLTNEADLTNTTLSFTGFGTTKRTGLWKGLVSHQYMYACGRIGETAMAAHVRMTPGESYEWDMVGTSTVNGDTAMVLCGINYYRELGDLGAFMTSGSTDLSISGKRLMKLVINSDEDSEVFCAPSVSLSTPLVEEIDLTGCSTISNANLDLSSCARLKTLKLGGTGIKGVTLPSYNKIETIAYGEYMTAVRLVDMAYLTSFSMEGYSYLETINISNSPNVDSYTVIAGAYGAQPEGSLDITLEDLAWTKCVADILMWLASMNAVLTGEIDMVSHNSDRYITLAEKSTLAALYGNIDVEGDGELYVVYDRCNITAITVQGEASCAVIGQTYTYTLGTTPTDGNNIAIVDGKLNIQWAIAATAATYATWNADGFDGSLTVTALDSGRSATHVVSATVNTEAGLELEASRNICFYNRIPQVGDFTYGDGTFDEVWTTEKDYIGMVFRVEDTTDDDGNEVRIAYVVHDTDLTITDGSTASYATHVWGLYGSGDGTSTGPDSTERTEIADATGLSSACNVPSLADITAVGLTTASGSSTNYVTESSYVDASADGGFKTVSGAAADFAGKTNTDIIVAHADIIIQKYLGCTLPTTMAELAQAIAAVVEDKGYGWARQFYFMAAYGCHLYEPSVSKGTLHAQYAAGNWYLPSAGELARLYNFYRQGHTTSGTANESADNEASTPIFVNAAVRRGGTAMEFIDTSGTYYWSSTEYSSTYAWYFRFYDGYLGSSSGSNKYNSYYVRPCSAFTFEL